MKKIIIFLVIVGILAFTIISSVKKIKNKDKKAINFSEFKTAVYAEKVMKGDVSGSLEYIGHFYSNSQVTVSAQIMQKVIDVRVSENDKVKKGQILLVLDNRSIQKNIKSLSSKINSLKLAIDSQKNQLNSAIENYNYQKKNLDRNKKLLSQKAISQEVFDRIHLAYVKAKNDRDSAKISINKLSSDLNSLNSNLEDAKIKFGYSIIKANANGIISKKLIEKGNIAIVGKPLFIIDTTDRYKIKFNYPLADSLKIKSNSKVYLETVSKKVIEKRISKIYPSVLTNMNLTAEIYLNKSEAKNFHFNEYVKIKVIFNSQNNKLFVSENSVITKNNKNYVYKIIDNTLHIQEIKIGPKYLKNIVVLSGLKENDEIATGSFLDIASNYNGQKVLIYGDKK